MTAITPGRTVEPATPATMRTEADKLAFQRIMLGNGALMIFMALVGGLGLWMYLLGGMETPFGMLQFQLPGTEEGWARDTYWPGDERSHGARCRLHPTSARFEQAHGADSRTDHRL